jgi:hypothetical protein
MDRDDRERDLVKPTGDVTAEVGSEGGSPGDVELDIDSGSATGTEAGETWQPTTHTVEEVRRDETGKGRRSP